MRFDRHAEFECSPDALLALFTDRDYFVHKHSELGASGIEVRECRDDGDRFAITVHQRVPQNTPLPGFMKKLVGLRIAVTQTDAWQRSTHQGRLVVELEAAPVTVGVDMSVQPTARGCKLDLHFELEAGVPVIGGRIERFLADDVIARMDDDLAVTHRLLQTKAA